MSVYPAGLNPKHIYNVTNVSQQCVIVEIMLDRSDYPGSQHDVPRKQETLTIMLSTILGQCSMFSGLVL